MDIQQLRHFVAAVDCGNMLRAAASCNISQSGISRSIAHLEERVGVQLLIRSSRGVELSVYGSLFLKRARLIINEVDQSISELRSSQSSDLGELVLGVTQNYGQYLIPDVVAALTESAPNLRLLVKTGGFLDLLKDLQEGTINLMFGLVGSIDDDAAIAVELLREHHSRVIARRSHPLALRGGEVSPAELALARWATLSSVGFQQNFVHYFLSEKLRTPVQVLKTDSIALIRKTIQLTDLLTVLPPDAVSDELDSGELVILDCDAPGEQTDVGILTRRASITTAHQVKLAEMIRAHFAPARPRPARLEVA
jgi:LysR family transcriptional regulator of abg operon